MASITYHQIIPADLNWERLLWGLFNTGGPAGSTVVEASTTRYVFQGTAAAGAFEGWRIVAEPQTWSQRFFTVPSNPSETPTGRIDRLELRDAAGQLVLVITDVWTQNFTLESLSETGRSFYEGQDLITGTAMGETLRGGAGNDTIEGGAGDDRLEGGAGADTLHGGAGVDTLVGGDGSDIYILDDLLDIIVEDGPAQSGGSNRDEVRLTFSTDYVLPDVIEIGRYTGLAGGVMTGNAQANHLWASEDANAAHTTLIGGEGNDWLHYGDVMRGGIGNDFYDVGSDASLQVIELENEGIDRVYASGIDYTLSANVENLIWSSDYNDPHTNHLSGNASNNSIAASIFGDVSIDGLDGNDVISTEMLFGGLTDPVFSLTIARIDGGGGDDLIGTATDLAILDGGSGIDTVTLQLFDAIAPYYGSRGAHIDLALGFFTAVGRLSFEGEITAAGQIRNFENAIGTARNDILGGDAGANVLRGMAGDDQLSGRAGDDRLEGGAGHDQLYGGAGGDELLGGDGNDVLVGDDPGFDLYADILDGGAGDDLIHADASDTVRGGAGFDSLVSVSSHAWSLDMATASIEYAVLDFGDDVVTAANQTVGVSVFTSGGNDTVTGSGFADLIFGGVGDDVIDGGAGDDAIVGDLGVDQLRGGDGDDRIYFDAQDTVVLGGAGYDAGYITAGAGGGAVVDMGAASLEFLQDTAGQADAITAATSLVGVSIFAGGGADTVTGSAFDDILWGEAGDDVLDGGAGSDVVVGGAGADRLAGGAGTDRLYGGAADGQQDVFVFEHAGAAHRDYVHEFETAHDRIDLAAFAGATFADVVITISGQNSTVSLNGQAVCIVVGVTDLTAANFVFGAPSAPDLGAKPDAPLVQPVADVPAPDLPMIRDLHAQLFGPRQTAMDFDAYWG